MKNKVFSSCSHKQMHYWGKKSGFFVFFFPESLRNMDRKSRISSQQATVNGRPWRRRRRPGTAPGKLLHSTKRRHADRGISQQPLLLSLLKHDEWLPASLSEHLMILILMTASVFLLPVYWWIIIPFGTESTVKLGTIVKVSTWLRFPLGGRFPFIFSSLVILIKIK